MIGTPTSPTTTPSLTDDNAASHRHEETGDSSTQFISAHDAWSRLVRVEYTTHLSGEYEYNGLNWRIIKRADTDLNKPLDQQRIMSYPRESNMSRLSRGDDLRGGSHSSALRSHEDDRCD